MSATTKLRLSRLFFSNLKQDREVSILLFSGKGVNTMTEMIVAYFVKSLWWIIPCVVVLLGTAIVEHRNGD